MKMPFAVVGAVALVARLASAAPVVVRASDEKTYAVELVSADPKARTITIRSDKGPSNLVVDGKALDDIQRLKPGDKIAVTVRDDASGRRQIVTAIVNGSISTPPEVRGGQDRDDRAVGHFGRIRGISRRECEQLERPRGVPRVSFENSSTSTRPPGRSPCSATAA